MARGQVFEQVSLSIGDIGCRLDMTMVGGNRVKWVKVVRLALSWDDLPKTASYAVRLSFFTTGRIEKYGKQDYRGKV